MRRSFAIKLLIILFVIITSAFAVLFHHHALMMLGLLALSYGLRHGLDADHILAIDNITRKFQAENQRSDATGVFFALGHSTIVFLLTVLIVVGVKNVHAHFAHLQQIGAIVGSVISALFLWLSAYLNFSTVFFSRPSHHHGLIGKYVSRFFCLIDKPSKIYWVGFLFGLGFDTATEVGLLSIAATSALAGFHLSLVLLLPALFAAGMVLTDSFDAVLMSSLYRATAKHNHRFRFYYQVIIFTTTILSLMVGLAELISISNAQKWHVQILDAINGINNHFELIGGVIVLVFLTSFIYIKSRQHVLPKMGS